MKNEDLEKRFRCGPVEAAYENSKWFSVFMKVLFLLVAIYFFWLMMGEAHLVEHLDNWAVLAFCLWRIHRQDDVMCYVTQKGLIVRRQFRSLREFYDDQFHEDRSLLFLLVAIYFFWLMTGEAHLVEHLDNWAVLAFCLWRIHRQDDVMCYVTRKGLIVRRQFRSLHEFYDDQFHEERSLIFLPYKDIFVISDNWQEIQLGEAEEGGLAVLPVHLQFLSKRNKQRIIDRIKQAHETDDDESAH